MSEPSHAPPVEQPPCAWCGGVNPHRLYRMEHLGIVRCQDCGLVFSSPRETAAAAAARYQAKEYFHTDQLLRYGYDDYGAHRAIHERMFAQALRHLERKLPQKGRLLDIGCALGFLLHVASERGWQPEGVELSSWACEQAHSSTGLPVHNADITSLTLDPGSFDAITMFDVIEHVYEPRRVLATCARLLRPGGFLYLITPNQGGYQCRLMGRRWFHYKPLEHTFFFDRRTLGRFLAEAGFEEPDIRRNLRWVTPRFLIERLHYYQAPAARVLSNVLGSSKWSERLELPLFTGEIEVLARRT